jgi:hypothetical protein
MIVVHNIGVFGIATVDLHCHPLVDIELVTPGRAGRVIGITGHSPSLRGPCRDSDLEHHIPGDSAADLSTSANTGDHHSILPAAMYRNH